MSHRLDVFFDLPESASVAGSISNFFGNLVGTSYVLDCKENVIIETASLVSDVTAATIPSTVYGQVAGRINGALGIVQFGIRAKKGNLSFGDFLSLGASILSVAAKFSPVGLGLTIAGIGYTFFGGLGSKIHFKGFSRSILSSTLYKSSCR